MTKTNPNSSGRLRSSVLLIVALGLALLSAACTSSEESTTIVPLTNDFATELGEAADALPLGESMALNEMTEFDWDKVHIFAAGTKRSLINESVGAEVYDSDLDGRYGVLSERFLAVFTLDGVIVDQGSIPGSFDVLEAELASSTATLTKTEQSGGHRITLGGSN